MVREILPQINTFVGCGDTRAINVIDINPKISASASVSKKKTIFVGNYPGKLPNGLYVTINK